MRVNSSMAERMRRLHHVSDLGEVYGENVKRDELADESGGSMPG
jgi:hypothetical protein